MRIICIDICNDNETTKKNYLSMNKILIDDNRTKSDFVKLPFNPNVSKMRALEFSNITFIVEEKTLHSRIQMMSRLNFFISSL